MSFWVYLSRKFDSDFHNIFVSKLGLYSLDGMTTRKGKKLVAWLGSVDHG